MYVRLCNCALVQKCLPLKKDGYKTLGVPYTSKSREDMSPCPSHGSTPMLVTKPEMRSVERGICPIATSTMNELFL